MNWLDIVLDGRAAPTLASVIEVKPKTWQTFTFADDNS